MIHQAISTYLFLSVTVISFITALMNIAANQSLPSGSVYPMSKEI